jgi:hypothetical protein
MEKKTDHLTHEIISFKTLESPTSRHEITSGRFKGWIMNTTLIMKKAIFTGMNIDNTPIIEISYVVESHPTPPEKR